MLFGEPISKRILQRVEEELPLCDVLLVIGTSAKVSPACEIPRRAKSYGAKVIEINLEKTELTDSVTDLFFQGSAVQICNQIISEMKKLKLEK